MSTAAAAREAVRERPFVLAALRAGVLNYRAAADFLDVDGDRETVATALRRFADELDPYATETREATVTMRSGVGTADGSHEGLLTVGGTALAPGGDATAVLAAGDVDARALAAVLSRLAAADVDVVAAGVAGGTLVVAVPRREGASAVRVVEDALGAVPA